MRENLKKKKKKEFIEKRKQIIERRKKEQMFMTTWEKANKEYKSNCKAGGRPHG